MLNIQPYKRTILAIDKSHISIEDFEMLQNVAPYIGVAKFGLEAQTATAETTKIGTLSREMLSYTKGMGLDCMWDGKYNDISKTVGNAVRNTALLNVWGMTVMVSSGMKSLEAAVANRGNSLIIGVTVLTSISAKECFAIYGRPPTGQVLAFTQMLLDAKAQAVVCAPKEIEMVRKIADNKLIVITPNIRMPDSPPDDQDPLRTMTPHDAISAGADYLVVGRPILDAESPVQAAQRIGEQTARACANRSMV